MAEHNNVSYMLSEEKAWKMLAGLYVADESISEYIQLLRKGNIPKTAEFMRTVLARFVIHDLLHDLMDMMGVDGGNLTEEEKARLRDIASRVKDDH